MNNVFVIEKGTVKTLYSDDLPNLGTQQIARASHVEPNEKGLWDVVLSDHPLNGEHAGKVIAKDIKERSEALRLEVEYINQHILGV